MFREVKILIKTNINYYNGNEESMNNQYTGKLYFKDHDYYLRYEENLEQGSVSTIIRWNNFLIPEKVILVRQGNVKMKQIFQEGLIYNSSYSGSFGTLNLETFTNHINIGKNKYNGKIQLDYNLKINNQISGNYILRIDYIINEVFQ